MYHPTILLNIDKMSDFNVPQNVARKDNSAWVPRAYYDISSALREIDSGTAYDVCISVLLGFPYTVSVFPCFPYMVMLPEPADLSGSPGAAIVNRESINNLFASSDLLRPRVNNCFSFQRANNVISTYICLYWIIGILCGDAIRPGRHPEGSQWSPGQQQWHFEMTIRFHK